MKKGLKLRYVKLLGILFITVVTLQITGCGKVGELEKKAEDMGYKVDSYDKGIVVCDNEVNYYYKKSFGRLVFDKFETTAKLKKDMKKEIKDNQGNVTVEKVSSKKLSVILSDTVVTNGTEGESVECRETYSYDCRDDFVGSTSEGNKIADPLGKNAESYSYISEYFITAGELKAIYDNGETIRNELNI